MSIWVVALIYHASCPDFFISHDILEAKEASDRCVHCLVMFFDSLQLRKKNRTVHSRSCGMTFGVKGNYRRIKTAPVIK